MDTNLRTTQVTAGDDRVTVKLEMPLAGGEPIGIVLAHGAGAGQDHPWLATVRGLLAAAGVPTLTFNYAYTEAGRSGPDRPKRLLPVHSAAVAFMRGEVDRVVLGGKSMGGRIGSHLVGDEDPLLPPGPWLAGMAYYGYPLVPMGRGTPRPVDHLHRIAAPQLFFAGTRDRLSPPDRIAPLVAGLPEARLIVVEDGDHSFKVLKRTPRTTDDVLRQIADDTAEWIGAL